VRVILATDHFRHCPESEFTRGQLLEPFERPARVESILRALEGAGYGPPEPPRSFGLAPILRVHDAAYVRFLEAAYPEWAALGRRSDAVPIAWAIRGLRSDRVPVSLDGRLSYYSFDGSSPFTAGTWQAVRSSADTALTGAAALASGDARAVFSLCRPPGHHAAVDYFGGYCYLNNAAIAAQYLIDHGARRVAILDVDYHHGNGTQSIYYRRSDVLFVSIHANPAIDYPYFLGYADETGEGAGAGCNLNLPLDHGADWPRWGAALDTACVAISKFGADALVVSLGLDTFRGDPISSFALESADYLKLGTRIARLGMPTLLALEGGYAIAELGTNVVNVLSGFEAG